MKTCWEILEIEITKDIKTIRHAYSKKIKQYHPEDDPQMYQSIRKAYQDAKEYAKADEDVENYQDNFQIVKESNQEKYISNLKDDNERLFINPQEFIDNEKSTVSAS